MRGNTVVWLGIQHVGDSKHEPIIEELKAVDCAKRIVAFIVENSLATRMEFYVGRSQAEITARFDSRARKNNLDAFDDIDSMFADIEASLTGDSSDSSAAS